jgi:hypothetical protein
MRRSRILLTLAILVLFVGVGAAAFFLGDTHAVQAMTVRRATPNDVAEAMKADRFFSTYRENTLILQGTVVSASATTLGLETGSDYSLTCALPGPDASVHVGDTVTVLAEGASAERQPSGVLLRECTIP